MNRIFRAKEGKNQPRNDPCLGSSGKTAKDAKESDREATIANTHPRVGVETRKVKRLGVDIIYEPSEPTSVVVE